MGYGEHFDYESSEQIFDEIRRFWNPKTGYDLRGASYARLRQTPLQWPCPPDDDERPPPDPLPQRRRQPGAVRRRGRPPTRGWRSPPRRGARCSSPARTWTPRELPDDDFPLVLNTGRLQHQWHTMTKTGKVDKLNKLDSGPFVEIHPVDAVALDIVDGQPVELTSRRGRAVLPAVVTDRVRPGNCFVPFHWNDEHGEYLTINALTNDAVDPESLQPEFKVCAVSLRPVKVAGRTGAPGRRRTRPRAQAAHLTERRKALPRRLFHWARRGRQPVFPVLPASAPGAPRRPAVGRRSAGRALLAPPRCGTRAASPVDGGPLVLWASQTGNAEEFAARVADRLGGAQAGQHGRHGAAGPRRRPRRAGDHQHLRRRRAARQRRRVLGSPRLGRCARPGRHALRGARHRRPLVRQLLRSRQVAGRAARRAGRDEDCSSAPNARPTTTSRWTSGPTRCHGCSSDSGRVGAPQVGGMRHHRPGRHRRRTVHPRQADPGAAGPQRRADRARPRERGAPVRL